ncbi:MAG: hypothetical protein CWE10_08710 [Symbiobacterium thermophilum]|uniref:GGDEF domain-containing protein n=1 Tax=Symbiobacterium thermophilum TaxID=2734 RepID=A0A953LIP6_SYMTR|nr:hypothetical protein [Symbiobacterium thermophilum]
MGWALVPASFVVFSPWGEGSETVARNGPLEQQKRRLLLVALPIASAAALFEWALLRRSGQAPSPLLLAGAAFALLLALLLWRRRRSLRFVETVLTAGIAVGLFVFLYLGLFSADSLSLERFARLSPWVSVALAGLLVISGSRRSVWIGTAVYLGLLALGLVRLFRAGPQPTREALFGPLAHFYLANAVLLWLMHAWSELQRQYARTRQIARSMASLAHTDPLLGIPNRRQMELLIEQEIRCAEEGGQPATMIMFDVDRFKQINDMYGHEAGDAALRAVATTVRQALRATDHVGRWGGDEFIILVRVNETAQAYQLAQRVGEAVHQKLSEHFPIVTISLGVAPYRPGDTVSSWVSRADAAMYRAKESGRNRVVVGS